MATTASAKTIRKPRKSSSESSSTSIARRVNAPEATSMTFPFAGDQWPATEYLAPLAFLRSALFGIVPKGRRKRIEAEAIASHAGFELRFTGEVLDQHDHDLWLVAVRQAREHGMGMNVHFTKRSLLKALGWDISGKSVERLRASFLRLVRATVEIEGKNYHYAGHLIDEVVMSKSKQLDPSSTAADDDYYFKLSPKMASLFGPEQSSFLSIADRSSIKLPLAKWLHAFIVSTPQAFPSQITKLREMSGSSESEKYRFRGRLTAAMQELVDNGILTSFRLDRTTAYIAIASRHVQAALPA